MAMAMAISEPDDDGLSFVIGDLHQLAEELDARLFGTTLGRSLPTTMDTGRAPTVPPGAT